MMNQRRKMNIRCGYFPVVLSLLFLTGISLSGNAQQKTISKLDSRLQSLVGQTASSGGASQIQSTNSSTPFRNRIVPVYDGKQIRIQLRVTQPGEGAIAQLRSVGMNIQSRFGQLVAGTILPENLEALADLDVVSTVYPYILPELRSVPGEGVEALRAQLVHYGNPALDGKGLKVGIISDSFGRVSSATPIVEDIDGDGINEIMGTDSQLSGDLPPVVELLKDGEGPAEWYTDEGRGMAELVYEMAPGAELAFYTAWESSADFANGIIALAEAGCKVIVDDVGYYTQPFYQDGEIALAVDKVSKEYDVVYLSSAGNDDSCSLLGRYSDVDPYYDDGFFSKIPKGYDFHIWYEGQVRTPTPFLKLQLPPGHDLIAILEWVNPYSGDLGEGATCDYDLYAFSNTDYSFGSIIAYSDNYQGGPGYAGGDPYEIIWVTNDGNTTAPLYLALNYHHGQPADFKILLVGSNDVIVTSSIRSTDSNMIYGQTAAEDCIAVAAVNVAELLSDGQLQSNPYQIDPAFYSSQGGVFPILFSATGEPKEIPSFRFKPDISSVDGTNTSFFHSDALSDEDDYPNFYGTSAAAPHAAAIAALMRQANPQLTAAEIRDKMRSAATDIFEYGVDKYTGWGLLFADDAIKAVLDTFVPGDPNQFPTITPTPEIVEPTYTPTPTLVPEPVDVTIPLNQVIVTDNLYTSEDLSNGQDVDDNGDRNLVVRWNIPQSNISDFHVYVKVDGGDAVYLGRTASSTATWFEWKSGQANTAASFSAGPEFGHQYKFMVFAMTLNGTPHFYGPFSTAGAVEFLENSPAN